MLASVHKIGWSTLGILIGLTLSISGQITEAQMRELESKLPPPATTQIDFRQHIRPILDASCLRCHGPERPDSGFRLDHRAAALRGGEHGIAIVPGQSARSPLIYYVARLVEDMEMPPPGKDKPLDQHDIALLRAWIDQGLPWSASTNQIEFSVTPALQWFTVTGDEGKFREHSGVKRSEEH